MPDRLRELVAACKGKRVVVFGDLIADEYVYGRIARVSREAPVLILEYNATEILPGGAGNAANNINNKRKGPKRARQDILAYS